MHYVRIKTRKFESYNSINHHKRNIRISAPTTGNVYSVPRSHDHSQPAMASKPTVDASTAGLPSPNNQLSSLHISTFFSYEYMCVKNNTICL